MTTINDLEYAFLKEAVGLGETLSIDDLRYRYYSSAKPGAISVSIFGAKGDGVTDDTTAFEKAILYAAGRTLVVPPGTYILSRTLVVPSDTTIQGIGKARLVSSATVVISASGGQRAEKPLAQDITSGAQTISTTIAHQFVVGDLVVLMSQRSSLVSDASTEWRLGYATPGATGAYFAEWHQVAKVNSTTSVDVRTPVLFPDYFKDKTRETDSTARDYASIRAINAVKNVVIDGLEISNTLAGGTMVQFNFCVNSYVRNCKFLPFVNGTAVNFLRSFECEAFNCVTEYDTALLPEIEHHLRNAFKVTSSQSCGFDSCTVINGTQCYDITYTSGSQCSTYGYIVNCVSRSAQGNGATTHGGTYASVIRGNRFQCDKNGISNRSRRAIIVDNIVDGRGAASPSYGINIYEGWARDCVISGNSVNNFYTGIAVYDGADAGESYSWVGVTIIGNTISNCIAGVSQLKSANNATLGTVSTGILVSGNTIRLPSAPATRYGILIPAASGGWRVAGNTVSAPANATGAYGVYVGSGSDRAYIVDNFFELVEFGVFAPNSTPTINLYVHQNHWGAPSPSNASRVSVGTGVTIARTKVFAVPSVVTRAASPGTAAGTDAAADAAVINSVVTALRNFGIIT